MKSFHPLLFLCFFLLAGPGMSQTNGGNGLTVKGIITHQGDRMKGATIRVYKKNRLVEEEKTRRDGTFRVRLALDAYYVIEFSHRNMVSKRLLYKTQTPDHEKRYAPFDIEVVMFEKGSIEKAEGPDFDLPLGIVEYSEEKEDFDYVRSYTTERLREQIQLLSERSQ